MAQVEPMTVLGAVANIAAILTALVALGASVFYGWDRRRKRRQLEAYLKAEKATGGNQGQRSILHLMAKLGLTEAELLQASFRSCHIVRRIAPNPATNRAEALLLEYCD
jgi:hypothetical protein